MNSENHHRRLRALLAAAGVAASLSAATPATADPSAPLPDLPPARNPVLTIDPPPVRMWRVEVGYRANFVTNPGYNPFSSDDYFGQFSLSVSRTVFVRSPFSFALGLGWDYGKTNGTARGDTTSLEMQRLLVPLEGRLHFGRWGYALLRAEPGVAVENVEVNDPTLSAPLTKGRWLFAGDLSAGYAFPVAPHTSASDSSPGIWVQADGGYGLVVEQRLDLTTPTSSTAVAVADGIDLGTLAMRGAFVRAGLALAF